MSAKRTRDDDAAAGALPAPDEARKPKKAKHGFRVGPENLPDGAWRRKVTKIKKELIIKAKVKKQYAKVKAEYQKQATTTPATTATDPTSTEDIKSAEHQDKDQSAAAPAPIHPERQALLDTSSTAPTPNHTRQKAPRASVTGANTEPNDPSAPRKSRQEEEQQQQLDDDEHRAQDRPHHQQKRPRKQKPDYYTKELAAAERAKQQAEERAAEHARREQERQRRIAERERYRKAMAKAKAPGRDGRPKVGRESRILLERVQRIMGK